MDNIREGLTPHRRGMIYRVVLSALALGVLYGLVRPEDVPAWGELAAALLGIASSGLAAANTPVSPPALDPEFSEE